MDEERTTLHRYYLDDADTALGNEAPPPYDVLFNTIAESETAANALKLAQAFAERAGRVPINAPAVVATLGRTAVAQRFAASKTIVAPIVERVEAAALRARTVTEPLVVRPVGSQAGIGLARVESTEELRAYLEEQAYPAYFVMPFVDYRNADGFFRKYRVMFVDGAPYVCAPRDAHPAG